MKKISIAIICILIFAPAVMAENPMKEIRDQRAIFENGYIQVIGESAGGQERYAAKAAARAVAQKQLVEVIKGLTLVGSTSVQQGMLAADEIHTAVEGTLKEAVVCGEEYNTQEGYARVCMRVNLRGDSSLYQSLAPALQNPPSGMDVPATQDFTPQAAAPVQKDYDGLIVIVEGMGFKPALVNRITTKNREVLFEPSKVSPQMLIERGSGGYTTSEAKAKILLNKWGCSSPLVVKCTKVEQNTEAVVSIEDALLIFEQNQKHDILPQAKVVFVL